MCAVRANQQAGISAHRSMVRPGPLGHPDPMTTKPRGNPAIDPAAVTMAQEALAKIAGH